MNEHTSRAIGPFELKLIHTSDWHIGRALYGRRRYEEFSQFLDWLAGLIEEEEIDALLVAGDVFDNSTPSNRAQELYYRFLCRVAGAGRCRVVVTAGNHDSPSFLNAPKELLRFLNVHVVGSPPEDPEEEVLVLPGPSGQPALIVCAVPYLRDRDIRKSEAGESLADKDRKLVEGIANHYRRVAAAAERVRTELGRPIPIVAMGHLFAAGGRTLDGDGVRELYVGSLAHVGRDIFPTSIDYLALGHLHVPQRLSGSETMRYSGSPIPMGFGEAAQKKSVCRVTFKGDAPAVTTISVPCFQSLARVRGDWEAISGRLADLAEIQSAAWLEVVYEGEEIAGDLRQRLEAAVEGTAMEILRVKNRRVMERAMGLTEIGETLDDLDTRDVFKRCLDAHAVPEPQRQGLLAAYGEALNALHDEDLQA